MPAYRDLTQADLELRLFHGFLRRQVVTKCRRRVNGAWTVVDAPFVDDWTERDHRALLAQLARTLRLGGFARAAFERGAMKGFAAVGAEWFGDGREYLDLTNLHVSEDARRQGIGRALFLAAARRPSRPGSSCRPSAHTTHPPSPACCHPCGTSAQTPSRPPSGPRAACRAQ